MFVVPKHSNPLYNLIKEIRQLKILTKKKFYKIPFPKIVKHIKCEEYHFKINFTTSSEILILFENGRSINVYFEPKNTQTCITLMIIYYRKINYIL